MAKFEERRTQRAKKEMPDARAKLIEDVIQMLRKGKLSYEIKSYLNGKVSDENEMEELVDEARMLLFQKKSKNLPVIHLIAFVFFVGLSLFALLYMFLFLPNVTGLLGGMAMSVIGTFFFFLFVILSMAFYKSWKPGKEHLERPRHFAYGIMFLLFLIPGVILAFGVSWRYEHVQKEVLKDSHDYSIGRVVSGHQFKLKLRRTRMNASNVRVSFMTRKGERIEGKYDVPESWHYYLPYGQHVLIRYNPDNPKNFEMTFDGETIQKYTSSDERMFTLQDLLDLDHLGSARYPGRLEKIAFGWKYVDRNTGWINLRHGLIVNKSRKGIALRMSHRYKNEMIQALTAEGFERDKRSGNRLSFVKDSMYFYFDHVMDVDRIDMTDRLNFRIQHSQK